MKFEISAGGIVYKKEGKNILWLVCQNSRTHTWGFPKGKIGDHTKGELMEVAALRETQEEGGVTAESIEKLPGKNEYFYKQDGELIKKNVYYYLMEYIEGDPKNHDFEMEDAKFVTKEEVLDTLSYDDDKKSFRKAVEIYEKKFL